MRRDRSWLHIVHPVRNGVEIMASQMSPKEGAYLVGLLKPRYPVPAIPIKVGWQPSGMNECSGCCYWYIASEDLLWTAWATGQMVVERKDSDELLIVSQEGQHESA